MWQPFIFTVIFLSIKVRKLGRDDSLPSFLVYLKHFKQYLRIDIRAKTVLFV